MLDGRERIHRVEAPGWKLQPAGVHMAHNETIIAIVNRRKGIGVTQHRFRGLDPGELALPVDVGRGDQTHAVGQPEEHRLGPRADGEDRCVLAQAATLRQGEGEHAPLPLLPFGKDPRRGSSFDLPDGTAELAVTEVGDVAELDVLARQGCHTGWTSSGRTRFSGTTRANCPLRCTATGTPRLAHRVSKIGRLLDPAMKR